MDPRAHISISTSPTRWWAGEYVRWLHPQDGRGKATLFARLPKDDVCARALTPMEAAAQADMWCEATSYVSMQRWHGGRGHRLAELSSLYLDLDVHRDPHLAALDRATLARTLLDALDAFSIPEPGALIDSGRGFYAVWRHTPLPPAAERRWRATQTALIDLMAAWGADRACSDPARILRLPGTINGRSGRMVRVVGGDGRVRDFDTLADAIFEAAGRPTRRELGERKAPPAKPAQTKSAAPRGMPPAKRFSSVLRDLERLRIDWGGVVPVGMRNT
jgi:hypothetical protein